VLVNAQGAIGDTGGGGGSAAFGLSAVRNAMVEWSLNLGEDVLQIVDGKFGGGGGTDKKISEHILVLCEHSVFLLKVCLFLHSCCCVV
jgi:hypothetical protein